MAARRKKMCVACGAALTGRAQRWCDQHRPDKSNRRRLAAAHKAAGDHERARQVLEAGRVVAQAAGVEMPEPTDEDLQPEQMQDLMMRAAWKVFRRLEQVVAEIPVGQLAATAKALFDGLDRMRTHQPIVGDVTYVHDDSDLED